MHTHLGSTSKLYFLHFSGHFSGSAVPVAVSVQLASTTALAQLFAPQSSVGTSLQSVGLLSSPTFPYWQNIFPFLMFLNFRNAFRFGFFTGSNSWFSQMSMLWHTSSATGARANQPTKARKKETVEAQKARMCAPCFLLRPIIMGFRFSTVAFS